MDIQTRKIEFVQAFLKLQSEELISRFESLLKSERPSTIQPMTLNELNERIDKSLLDSQNDKVTEGHQLIEEIQQWS